MLCHFPLGRAVLRISVIPFDIATNLNFELGASRVAFQKIHVLWISRTQIFPDHFHLAQCGRQAHSSDLSSDGVLQATEEGPKMHAPFIVQQRMEFINDDGPGAHEQGGNLKAPEDKHGLKGFRGDEQYPFRVGPGAGFHPLRNIPVPRVDWKVCSLAEILHASQLVVDERLERRHVDQIESGSSW